MGFMAHLITGCPENFRGYTRIRRVAVACRVVEGVA